MGKALKSPNGSLDAAERRDRARRTQCLTSSPADDWSRPRDVAAAAPCWTDRTPSLEAVNPVAYGKINHFLTGFHSTNSLGLAVSRRSFGQINLTSAEKLNEGTRRYDV
jgi:hypothetical protein